jgi:hypothetical protein
MDPEDMKLAAEMEGIKFTSDINELLHPIWQCFKLAMFQTLNKMVTVEW